jgi:hypothetical protein
MQLPRPSDLADYRRLRPALALALLAACVTLAACGSSASSSTSTTNTSTGTAAAPAQSAGPGRFAALRSCLQKHGITLPPRSRRSRTPGAPGAPGGLLGGGGGLQLPKGVSQAQFQEALKKCGAGNFPGGGRLSSATAKAALTKFAACMRENGIKLPAPNTSGNGPIFNTGGIDTSGATFKAAEGKCRSDLQGAFAGRGGPPKGTPPSSGGGAPAGEAGGA